MSIRNGKVAYKSPIETTWSDIEHDYVEQIEQMVLTAVQNVGIMVDKEELIKALAYDREQYRRGWEDRDSEIVRCDDCVHCADDYVDTGFGAMPQFTCDLFDGYGVNIKPGHYCSYGEKR